MITITDLSDKRLDEEQIILKLDKDYFYSISTKTQNKLKVKHGKEINQFGVIDFPYKGKLFIGRVMNNKDEMAYCGNVLPHHFKVNNIKELDFIEQSISNYKQFGSKVFGGFNEIYSDLDFVLSMSEWKKFKSNKLSKNLDYILIIDNSLGSMFSEDPYPNDLFNSINAKFVMNNDKHLRIINFLVYEDELYKIACDSTDEVIDIGKRKDLSDKELRHRTCENIFFKNLRELYIQNVMSYSGWTYQEVVRRFRIKGATKFEYNRQFSEYIQMRDRGLSPNKDDFSCWGLDWDSIPTIDIDEDDMMTWLLND